VTDQIFDRLPAFQARAEMLREPHNAAAVTPYVVAAFAADAEVFARLAAKQKTALDTARDTEYVIPAEAIHAAAAARNCLWSPREEGHPDGESCGICLKAAKHALDAAAAIMLAPMRAKLAAQDEALTAVLEITASIGRNLSMEGAEGTEADYALFGLANRISEAVTTIIEGKS
jgi:hypothetical protein